jgi:hypothetical protein
MRRDGWAKRTAESTSVHIQLPHRQPASKVLGRVADFCPICRQPTSQVLRMHGQALHWYGMRIGHIELQDYTRTCEACVTAYPAEEGHYRDKAGWRRLPLDVLIARTQPNLAQKYAHRLELEARLLVAPELLTPGERQALVREPFELLAPRVAHVLRNKPWDLPTVAAIVFALFVPLPAAAWVMDHFPDDPSLWLWIAGGLCAAALVVAIVLNQLASSRYLRRRVLPRIARTLRPLEPTDAEVSAAMTQQFTWDGKFGTPRHIAWMLAALREPSRGA